jgi:type IV secretion system protein VirB8
MLEKIKKFFRDSDSSTAESQTPSGVKNWYIERYDSILAQRNILLLFAGISIIAVCISIFAVSQIISTKTFHPIVIQVEESTGRTVIVNPINSEILGGNEALARYFIYKYIIARETYNAVDFDTIARKTVRLFSKTEVYGQYLNYINNQAYDPKKKYGNNTSTTLKVKSWNTLDKDSKKMIVRFSVNEIGGSQKIYNKIAVIEYDYVAMELSSTDNEINPVGFQILTYRVDDDNS